MTTPLLVFHVLAGSLALLGGATALIAGKGGSLHRRAGQVFVITMLAMSASGALLAAWNPPNRISVIAGVLSFYLVASGWQTVHARLASSRTITATLSLAAALVGSWGVSIALTQTSGAGRVLFGAFAGLALLGAMLDLHVLRHGPRKGRHRLLRHLWRMTLAMLLATASLFLGQADELPAPWRIWPLLALPPLAVLAALCRWLWRIGRGPRRLAARAGAASDATQSAAPLPLP